MIFYTGSVESITVENLRGFFVSWPDPPLPDMHLRLLANSDHAVLAIEDQTGEVVGFITALTDDVLTAYIPLLEVKPAYQGRGIGHELMRRILEKLGELYTVDLFCDEHLASFYAPFGMKAAFGMRLRKHGWGREGQPCDARDCS
jgi:ribosomal protein S18 acetylase RimI-like enzyme